jgi:hypothetical protein
VPAMDEYTGGLAREGDPVRSQRDVVSLNAIPTPVQG